jgi:hypothetical protein
VLFRSIYKRVVAWFPGPVEDTERLRLRFRRPNRGLDTGNWSVRAQGGTEWSRLVLSIDTASVTVLEGLRWRPFSTVWDRLSSPY